VKWTNVRSNVQRCRKFLTSRNPAAAKKAALVIRNHLLILKTNPEAGRPSRSLSDFRELVIGFGDSGYVALYYFDRERDLIVVAAFRHQREAGY
jgi:plasmid stabilization system protein ParE